MIVALLIVALSQAGSVPPDFTSAFQPNAEVCVKFDSGGRPVAAAVDGRLDRDQLNANMLKLLQTRHWGKPPANMREKWFALSVAPDGSPVPEVLPDCSSLPKD